MTSWRRAVHQRDSERPRCVASQKSTRASDPSGLRWTLQDQCYFLGACFRQCSDQACGLCVPPPSHFCSQHHQARSRAVPPISRSSIVVSSPGSGGPTSSPREHQSRVDGQLGSATASSLRPCNALKATNCMSRTNMLVGTRAPASLQTCAAAHSK